MRYVVNLLALVGLLAIGTVLWTVVKFGPVYEETKGFDSQALHTYLEMGKTLLDTGNSAEATVWKVKVAEGMSADDVEQTMKTVANELNFKNVGEDLPLYKEIEALSGKPYRFVKIFMFCNALTAAEMLNHSDAYAAYLPCRITLIEDPDGTLWLYTLNLDMMIHGGKPLPADLKAEALSVRNTIREIIDRAAEGDF